MLDTNPAILDATLEAMQLMGMAYRRFFHEAFQADAKALGNLSPHALLVLIHIHDAALMSPSTIARNLAIARPNVTAILKQLKGADYVQVQADPADGRRQGLLLTAKGLAILEQLTLRKNQRMRSLFAGYSPEALAEIRDGARRMTQVISNLV